MYMLSLQYSHTNATEILAPRPRVLINRLHLGDPARREQQPVLLLGIPCLPLRRAGVPVRVGVERADEAGPVRLDDGGDQRVGAVGGVARGRAAVRVARAPDRVQLDRVRHAEAVGDLPWVLDVVSVGEGVAVGRRGRRDVQHGTHVPHVAVGVADLPPVAAGAGAGVVRVRVQLADCLQLLLCDFRKLAADEVLALDQCRRVPRGEDGSVVGVGADE